MTEEELHRVRQEMCEVLRAEIRLSLDLDIDDPKEVRRAKTAMAWSRDTSERCNSIANKVIVWAMLSVASVVGGVLFLGIKEWLRKNGNG